MKRAFQNAEAYKPQTWHFLAEESPPALVKLGIDTAGRYRCGQPDCNGALLPYGKGALQCCLCQRVYIIWGRET